jgi:hypothetical protein
LNGFFIGSYGHPQSTVNLLSMIASAKLHDLDPEEYLRDIFRVLPLWPNDRYLELAPKRWAATRPRLDAAELEQEIGWLKVPPSAGGRISPGTVSRRQRPGRAVAVQRIRTVAVHRIPSSQDDRDVCRDSLGYPDRLFRATQYVARAVRAGRRAACGALEFRSG